MMSGREDQLAWTRSRDLLTRGLGDLPATDQRQTELHQHLRENLSGNLTGHSNSNWVADSHH